QQQWMSGAIAHPDMVRGTRTRIRARRAIATMRIPTLASRPRTDLRMNPLHVVILAAGEGKRMKSSLPKVLQKIAGQPMLAHAIAAARELQPAGIHVVHGHGGEQVQAAFADQPDLHWAEQKE